MKNCEIDDKNLHNQCVQIGDGCSLHNLIIGKENAAQFANRFGKQRGVERIRTQKQRLQKTNGCPRKNRVELMLDTLETAINRMA